MKVWRLAHELALEVSNAVEEFPKRERFELTSQLRRASLSVPTNIAEGQGRYGAREALRFARIASGSLAEVDYLLFFSMEKGYLTQERYTPLNQRRIHVARLLTLLIRSLPPE